MTHPAPSAIHSRASRLTISKLGSFFRIAFYGHSTRIPHYRAAAEIKTLNVKSALFFRSAPIHDNPRQRRPGTCHARKRTPICQTRESGFGSRPAAMPAIS